MKALSNVEYESPVKFRYESLVKTIRKPCQVLNTKALSKGEYESSVKFLDTKALPNVDYESLAF